MEKTNASSFYPDCFKITDIVEHESEIIIKLKSQTHRSICPSCGAEARTYHGTYTRTVQDLPILGKKVKLKITEYEYICENIECGVVSFTENYGGFLSPHERMTTRCADLIRVIALETSCEGASRICRELGITVSGDTIIKMLRNSVAYELPFTGSVIGIDDFAYRKGHNYCTVVCDGETHRPIEVLEGRDGSALKEWLLKNKSHIKAVTRDRAGAYAKVISEVLPEAMQIADRFHLYQNLLKAVKEALKLELPTKIKVPNSPEIVQETTLKVTPNLEKKHN
jgi:transposase